MKYFIHNSERHGTCYHEFVQGEWDEEAMIFWSGDSLYLHDDIACVLHLYRDLFKAANVEFNAYGITKITLDEWNALVKRAGEAGGEIFEFIEELRPWAEENFRNNKIFTILGI